MQAYCKSQRKVFEVEASTPFSARVASCMDAVVSLLQRGWGKEGVKGLLHSFHYFRFDLDQETIELVFELLEDCSWDRLKEQLICRCH